MFPALVVILLVFAVTLLSRSLIDVACSDKVVVFASAAALACSAVVFAVFAVSVAFPAAVLAAVAVSFAVFAVDAAPSAAVFACPAVVLASVASVLASVAAVLAASAVVFAVLALSVASLILPRTELASVSDPIISAFKSFSKASKLI